MTAKGAAIFLLLVMFHYGCDDRETCTVNSIDDLGWLKAEIQNNGNYQNSLYDMIVYRVVYKGNTAIISVICCPACNTTPPKIRNCSGKIIGQIGLNDYGILDTTKIIWRSHNGVCL